MNYLWLIECEDTVQCGEVESVVVCGPDQEWVMSFAANSQRYNRFHDDGSNLEVTNLGIASADVEQGAVHTAYGYC